MREVCIKPVLNGFIVRVGCQEVVFNSIDALLVELRRYYLDPGAVEKEYRQNAINKILLPMEEAPPQVPPPTWLDSGKDEGRM